MDTLGLEDNPVGTVQLMLRLIMYMTLATTEGNRDPVVGTLM